MSLGFWCQLWTNRRVCYAFVSHAAHAGLTVICSFVDFCQYTANHRDMLRKAIPAGLASEEEMDWYGFERCHVGQWSTNVLVNSVCPGCGLGERVLINNSAAVIDLSLSFTAVRAVHQEGGCPAMCTWQHFYFIYIQSLVTECTLISLYAVQWQ